ncbi:hypothetical protein PIB30_045661 [Stylosanthes scabra]|uniref:Uncharacterized protein n=1 Tax=Stylosanthes scabra TaxID=79078 RepID=A0ABU6QFM3_9FABA|nr:hypothetical protein [Stylosanthes scabra]
MVCSLAKKKLAPFQACCRRNGKEEPLIWIDFCSGVNAEPDEPSPLQAWAVATSPVGESPMKQAGGRGENLQNTPTLKSNAIHVSIWATSCYRSVLSDLLSQVGSPGGMWVGWVRSAFCVAWLNGPPKIGPRWVPSLSSEIGYEHCPYAELWLLTPHCA